MLLMKNQHVADVVVEFYGCVKCAKGVYGGLNGTTIHQYLRNVCRKFALLKSFNFATSKEPSSHSFWATGLILVSKKRKFWIYKVTESFFLIFETYKIYTVWNFSFLCKKSFFWKKITTRKLKWNSKKKLSVVL